MTQVLEQIAMGTFGATEANCPFKDDGKKVGEDPENVLNDDLESVTAIQSNNGGTLGGNLEAGRHSEDADTFNDIPRAAPPNQDVDSWRHLPVLHVPFTGELIDEYGPAAYVQPYNSSAHHLIPGNASLASSDLYKRYMKVGGEAQVKVEGVWKTWTIKFNIGYNVNGSHNGVWLPNNFAIQAKGTPTGIKWSAYTAKKVGSDERKWIVAYIATATKWKGRQFHDSHTTYNRNVKDLMKKICAGLLAHQGACKECLGKANQEIPPPYKAKLRLYAISRVLRSYTIGSASSWRDRYLTSDQFAKIKKNAGEWAWFQEVYNEAHEAP